MRRCSLVHVVGITLLAAGGAFAAGCGDNLAGPIEPPPPPDPDPAAPTAEILSPAPASLLGEAVVAVRVRVLAEAGVAKITVSSGDATTEIAAAALDDHGEATAMLTLSDGAHALHLAAEDTEHRTASDDAAIMIDASAPTLDVIAPRAETAETRRLLFAQVADATGIATVAYAVNGAAAVSIPVTGAPSELAIREALPLVAGDNTIDITVTDGLGHARHQTLALRYGLTTTGGGAHSGAISAGELYTWGRYNQGQLGLGGAIGDAQSRLAPEKVPAFGAPDTEVAAIAFNQNHSLAIRSDGTVWTWGANADGQLGHGDIAVRTVPTQLAGLADVVYAHLGFSHSLALRADGTVLAWGNNAAGQTSVDGNGTTTDDQLVPVVVAGIPSPVVKLVAGSQHSVALTVDGRVYAWGNNESGNLGTGAGDKLRHPVPAAVAGLDDAIDIATGRDHVIAVRADGSVVAWGLGASGQLGYGAAIEGSEEDRALPVAVTADADGTPLRGARAVFANGNTSYAIIAGADGGAPQCWGWGQNFNGQLAIGATSTEERFARRAVFYAPGDAPVFLDQQVALSSIGTGATHTIVRTASGALFAWGWSFRGSLGVPTLANAWAQTVAVEVALP